MVKNAHRPRRKALCRCPTKHNFEEVSLLDYHLFMPITQTWGTNQREQNLELQ